MTAPAGIRIGTSGWHYKHWVGPFYPMGLRPTKFLAHYARHFATAEIDAQRLPGLINLQRKG